MSAAPDLIAELIEKNEELRRRIDAISPEPGKIVCTGVVVNDAQGRERVRLYADQDDTSHGLDILNHEGHLAAALNHCDHADGNSGGVDLFLGYDGIIRMKVGVDSNGPAITDSDEDGEDIQHDQNLLRRVERLETLLAPVEIEGSCQTEVTGTHFANLTQRVSELEEAILAAHSALRS
jgi:hypothetical protein